MPPVDLAVIAEAIDEPTFDGEDMFVNVWDRVAGKVLCFSAAAWSAAEDGLSLDECRQSWSTRDVDEAELAAATAAYARDDVLVLPKARHAVDEWRVMRDFAESRRDERQRDRLTEAVHGSGAFRRFRHAVDRLDLWTEWNAWRLDAFLDAAEEWCDDHGLAHLPRPPRAAAATGGDYYTELRRLEPIFHRAPNGITREYGEALAGPGYWEVGASGRVYRREDILAELQRRHDAGEPEPPMKVDGFAVATLGEDTYLATYELTQHLPEGDRVTRRATWWEWTGDSWQALYHQGTLVAPA